MLDRVLKYYSNDLSSKTLLFSKMKFENVVFWILLISFMPIAITLNYFRALMLVLPLPLLFLAYLYYFNEKAKKVLDREYGIKPTKGSWAGEEYHNYIRNKIKIKLDEEQINTSLSLEKLTDRLSKRIDDNKMVVLFVPGVFFGFMVPTWAAYNSTILFKGRGFEDATLLLMQIFVALILLGFLFGVVKFNWIDIFTTKKQKLKQLLDILQDIQLDKIKEDTQRSKSPKDMNVKNRVKLIVVRKKRYIRS